MRYQFLAAAAAALLAFPPGALSGTSTVASLCKQADYQCVDHPVTIHLLKANGSTYSHTYQAPVPIVEKGTLVVMPGDTLYLDTTLEKDRIVRFRLVSKAKASKDSLSLQFEQSTVRGHKEGMILRVDNPFKRPLKYHAGYQLLGAEAGKFYPTGTCPVAPGKQAVELWTYPLARLRLSDFHFVAPITHATKCDY